MRWIVDQAVRGHDAVKARATDPVMTRPVFCLDINELDARARSQDILVRRFGP